MAKIKAADGTIHNIKTIAYKPLTEQFSEYELEDGSKIHVRTTLTHITKSDQYSPDGEPIYYPILQTVWRAIVPEKLQKEPTVIHSQTGPEQKDEKEKPGGYL